MTLVAQMKRLGMSDVRSEQGPGDAPATGLAAPRDAQSDSISARRLPCWRQGETGPSVEDRGKYD